MGEHRGGLFFAENALFPDLPFLGQPDAVHRVGERVRQNFPLPRFGEILHS